MINVIVGQDHLLQVIVNGQRVVNSTIPCVIEITDQRKIRMESGRSIPISVIQWLLREYDVSRDGSDAEVDVKFVIPGNIIEALHT